MDLTVGFSNVRQLIFHADIFWKILGKRQSSKSHGNSFAYHMSRKSFCQGILWLHESHQSLILFLCIKLWLIHLDPVLLSADLAMCVIGHTSF